MRKEISCFLGRLNIKKQTKIDNSRLDSLDALKGVAFWGIFFLHVNFAVEWAAFGVSLFFVISGYLLESRHLNDIKAVGGGTL